ncbi:MAG TPA: LytR C-terminal domain-containing protein [Gaiellaceae bacterium]|nr:LytR C-terminal domain-containing protein [Gaiellaceae bacterium]
MEHAQPFTRPFPWRMAALVTSLVALATIGGLLAMHHPALTRPASQTAPAAKPRQTAPLRPRSRVSVLVLNGNGTSGVAGATATQLLGRGYHSATATNASLDNYATSLVLYRPGWEREAQRLARDAGIRVVAALDGRLPAGSARDQLVVILGAN